jgi:hypothetical protein
MLMAENSDTADDTSAEDVLGFDPRETGPVDLYAQARDRLVSILDTYGTVLIASVTVLIAVAWWQGVQPPEVPTWLKLAAYTSLLASGSAWVVGKRLARWVHTPDDVLLSVQNAKNGDQRLIRISPDRLDSMRILNHNGEQRDREFLHKPVINGRTAYEVDHYHVEQNTAVASWQAGVSNSEIRADRASIDRIKTKLEREADKALELAANHSAIVREHATEVAHYLIATVEGVEVPSEDGGQRLDDRLTKLLDQNDVSEQVLGGDDEQADDDLDDDGRASNGSVEIESNGDGVSIDLLSGVEGGEADD